MAVTQAPPTASVIVPAYNAAKTLGRTLDSLLHQTIIDWEVIVVDDGSRDRTHRFARRRAMRDSRIRVIRQKNGGASAARNAGLAQARADRVVFLDADDWIAPDFLETLLPLAGNGKALAYCGYQRVLSSGKVCPVDFCSELQSDPLSVLTYRCEPAIHCVIAPREMVLAVGGFDDGLRCCEDWDLWLRLARAGCTFSGVARPLAFYQMLPGSLSTENSSGDRDAELVMQRARQADERLPPDAPFRDGVVPNDHTGRHREIIRQEISRIVAGEPPSADWFEKDVPGWSEAIRTDPENFPALVGEALKQTSLTTEIDRVCSWLVEGLASMDADLAIRLQNAIDYQLAKAQDGIFGRYMSVAVGSLNPCEKLSFPLQVDALVLRVPDPDGTTECVTLPAEGLVSKQEIADALVEAIPIVSLLRSTGALRSPGFWRGALRALCRPLPLVSAAMAGNVRGTVGHVLRAGMLHALRGGDASVPAIAPQAAAIPILMVPRITANDSSLLADSIGYDQFLALMEFLGEEGYGAVSLPEIMAIRSTGQSRPARTMAVVFTHLESAQANDFLHAVPHPAKSVNVLLTAAEIDRIDAAGRLPAGIDPANVCFGLKAPEILSTTFGALAEARALKSKLESINGDGKPVCALGDRQGLDEEILRKAGFSPILTPASMPLRPSSFGHRFPAIECSGSEAFGTVVECLRFA